MNLLWAEKIIALHPLAVTGIFIALFVAAGVANNIYPLGSPQMMGTWAVTTGIMIGPVILWHYSLYRVATNRAEQQSRLMARQSPLFLVLVITVPAFLALFGFGLPLANGGTVVLGIRYVIPALMFVMVFSYFGAIWNAASALRRFEMGRKPVPWYATVGTFFLEFYLPIGIWFLHKRIQKLLAAVPAPIDN